MEYVIYTDESDREGDYFSNFYGGVLVRSSDLADVIKRMEGCKLAENLFGEIKWQKVTGNYLIKYKAVMDAFFDEIAADRAKVRIMFTSNQYIPQDLSAEQRQTEYHRLYYQFIKHSFGLQHSPAVKVSPVRVRLNLDQMPTSREETARFKAFLAGLNQNPQLMDAGISFDVEQMAEVSSHNHVLLQCVDIVLGAMVFRLNNKHLIKPDGQRTRGKRTIAKEKLYKHISDRIRQIYPNFNIGESTGVQGDITNRWKHPYRHWKLIPTNHVRDRSKAKP
ncbi:MAG: DUF3800 domain-containing protein [Verrucomicrobiae bacterium]|nr:DUF3800 domain-containing protein [Verrucomicrobiae bacterium]